jgi:hypothetical protein
MRPSFVSTARCPSDDAIAVLKQRIKGNPDGIRAAFSKRQAVLHGCVEKQRFWSPRLDVTIEEVEDLSETAPSESDGSVLATTRVSGTFSPRAEIWTGLVFAIGTLLVASLFALMFGLAQITLGWAPWALLIPVVALLLAAGIYASALIGQGLSGDEMPRLRSYVDTCLKEAEELNRRRPPERSDFSSQL